jgi:Zn-finger nucleic acid-binding protein
LHDRCHPGAAGGARSANQPGSTAGIRYDRPSEVPAMNCPECAEAKLQTVKCIGVMVDECPRCKGRWFGRDELDKARDSLDDDLRWLDFDLFTVGPGSEPSGKSCPRCQLPMGSVKYGQSGVSIEVCSQCRGTWLNSGEFERMVRHLERVVNTTSAAGYAKEAVQEMGEIVTGPESLGSEARDFMAVMRLLRLRVAVENPTFDGDHHAALPNPAVQVSQAEGLGTRIQRASCGWRGRSSRDDSALPD